MEISQKGIDLIKQFEGFKGEVYHDLGGHPTIGYGHEIKPHETYTTIDEEVAEALLHDDLEQAENTINNFVKVPLTQNEFDALVSLVYNIGTIDFVTSKGLNMLNNGQIDDAVKQFFDSQIGFVQVNGIISLDLVRRRLIEAQLFNALS